MEPFRILYRADAGKSVGTGHVLRAKRVLGVLAQMVKTEAILAIANDPIGLRLSSGAAAQVVLTGPLRSNGGKPLFDPSSLSFAHGEAPFDLLAVDMLDTPPRALAPLRALARVVVTFDDRGSGRVDADAIINVLVREQDRTALPAYVFLAEGPEYATLDSVYAEAAPVRHIRHRDLDVIVTLGGADTGGLTVKVLRALRRVDGIAGVMVVCGIGSDWQAQAEEVAGEAPWRMKLVHQAPNLRSLFLSADIALVAGGLTMHEACCTGTPAIAVCQPIDHQAELASWFAERNAMLTVGDGATADEADIAREATRLVNDTALRAAMSAASRKLVDGRGTERTAKVLLNLAGCPYEECHSWMT